MCSQFFPTSAEDAPGKWWSYTNFDPRPGPIRQWLPRSASKVTSRMVLKACHIVVHRFLREHHVAMTTGPMNGKNTHLRLTGAAVFNDLFRSYGHEKGYIYDFDELLSVADEAEILVPTGDCAAEPTSYRVSSRMPHVANLDDSVKAHETLYVDFVCGSIVDGR